MDSCTKVMYALDKFHFIQIIHHICQEKILVAYIITNSKKIFNFFILGHIYKTCIFCGYFLENFINKLLIFSFDVLKNDNWLPKQLYKNFD